jgi:hypothetical protein
LKNNHFQESMGEEAAIRGVETLRIPFLRATETAESENRLTELICEHADPIITRSSGENYGYLSTSPGSEQYQERWRLPVTCAFFYSSSYATSKQA